MHNAVSENSVSRGSEKKLFAIPHNETHNGLFYYHYYFFAVVLCAPLRVCTFPQYVWVCVCVCALYCGNFLWAPLPWLMDAPCVPCLALSRLIYIKQCGKASISLRLCCTCHLGICLPASQFLSLSGVYQDLGAHFISFQLSYLLISFSFRILIWASRPGPRALVCACTHGSALLLDKSPCGFCSASCTVVASYFIAAAHFDFQLFQSAAEFDIIF